MATTTRTKDTRPTHAAPAAPDVRALLSDEALATLRRGYSREVMLKATTQTLAALYAPSAPLVTGFIPEALYGPAPIAPRDRERCLIAVLGARGGGLTLAVHLYWGLMEGLGVEEIAHTLLLTAVYEGIPCLAQGMLALRKTLAALGDQATKGADAAASPAVLQRLLADFPA